MAMWLLIIITGFSQTRGGTGVEAVLVTEQQCRAVLAIVVNTSQAAYCFAPDGTERPTSMVCACCGHAESLNGVWYERDGNHYCSIACLSYHEAGTCNCPKTTQLRPNLSKQLLIDGKIELRPHEDGSFDELVMYDKTGRGKVCLAHAEMMDHDNHLWIAFYPPGERERRVCLWITAKGGKLKIHAEDESI